MKFSYEKGSAYAKSLGLEWNDKWVENFDQMAEAHGFTQSQVDIAIQHHLWQVRYLFNPKIYTFKQRLALAFFFIFGKI